MNITGINGYGVSFGSFQMNMKMSSDTTSKNLQSQIANAQKQMQELASNKEMSPEDKMNKRKEIQEQINELQNQLRQHQIEQRKENLQKNTSSMEDMIGGSRQTSQESAIGTGISDGNMQTILSANSAMTQVKSQGAAKTQVKGKAEVLKAEIKQDGARGGNVERKHKQLEVIEANAQKLESNQMDKIAYINKKLSADTKEDSVASQTGKNNKKASDSSSHCFTEEVVINKSEPVGNNMDVKL